MIYEPASKVCRGCDEVFLPHEGEPRYRWKDRTTCGVKCGRNVGRSKGHATRRLDGNWDRGHDAVGMWAVQTSTPVAASAIVLR